MQPFISKPHLTVLVWFNDQLNVNQACISIQAFLLALTIFYPARSMKQATHYKIAYSYKCFSVYDGNSLIGKIEKPLFGRWPINLEINGNNYLLESSRIFNSIITVHPGNIGEAAGKIYVSGFLGLFSKVTYEYGGNKQIKWKVKDFFSLHWQWEKNKQVCMDTIETIQHRRPIRAIAITEEDTNNNFLILTGIFLSLLRKSRLSFGIFWF